MIIGIMGAMPDEVEQLCAKLENVTVEPYGGVEYHKGTRGQPRLHPRHPRAAGEEVLSRRKTCINRAYMLQLELAM